MSHRNHRDFVLPNQPHNQFQLESRHDQDRRTSPHRQEYQRVERVSVKHWEKTEDDVIPGEVHIY